MGLEKMKNNIIGLGPIQQVVLIKVHPLHEFVGPAI